MKSTAFVWMALSLTCSCFAQRSVLNYPFEFEKGFLQKGQYDAYFLENRDRGNFAFILRDNKKANYVLVDGRFKVAAEFTKRSEETVFNHDAAMYLGGTSVGNIFHYVYKVTDKKFIGTNSITYMMETVDFGAGSISDDKAFEIPKEEELLVSFSDHNRYFTITANKKTSDLQFYQVSANGQATSKTFHFNIPPGMKKDKNELTGYLAGLKLIREEEEPGLDLATHRAKLFCYADKLVFTVNTDDRPTHLFIVDLNSFSSSDKFIDHAPLLEKENRGKSYVNSFLKDNKLFSLILNKKDIKVAVYNEDDGSLINNTVIDADYSLNSLAQTPVADLRTGAHRTEKDVDNLRKVIKAFTSGTEGLSVMTNKSGQYILQIGTYDLIPMSSGGAGGHYMGGWDTYNHGAPIGQTMVYDPFKYYIPGYSGYTTTSGKYYKTIYFKLLLDPTTLKPTTGRVSDGVGEQIKDFMDDSNPRLRAAKQFAMGGRQYYGYYDQDTHSYSIQEILLRK